MNTDLPNIFAFWAGSTLSEIELCCLRPFALRGHRVYLYSYKNIKNLPDGVTLRDATTIMSENEISLYGEKGRYSSFSDMFSYHLLKKENVIYVDCDIYCLA